MLTMLCYAVLCFDMLPHIGQSVTCCSSVTGGWEGTGINQMNEEFDDGAAGTLLR